MKFISLLILLCFAAFDVIYAQESVNTAGNNAEGQTGSVTYTVGQINVATKTSEDASVLEGVQQPYEIFVVTAVDDSGEFDLELKAFPNPVSDFLTLTVNGKTAADLSYSLTDLKGNVITWGKVMGSESKIQTSDFSSGTYFLTIENKNGFIKTFKIVKH